MASICSITSLIAAGCLSGGYPCLTSSRLIEERSLGGALRDLRVEVIAWILSRAEDPYQGVRREPGFDNPWYGSIPFTQHDRGQVVICAYWIHERSRAVRCERFGSLSLPI